MKPKLNSNNTIEYWKGDTDKDLKPVYKVRVRIQDPLREYNLASVTSNLKVNKYTKSNTEDT